ncbi:hypothetical protein [Mycolicibacterium baixiangningiae]|uniref:hypothetical protein n=1 Tax=Mycolicibacterium baixiangningiae TaxID=2761578 RepID=UPI0018D051B1|nr:hypothetical protein [Mycolicibacterium baixiangningiae]
MVEGDPLTSAVFSGRNDGRSVETLEGFSPMNNGDLFSHPVVNEPSPAQESSPPVQNPEFSDAPDEKKR